MANALTARFPGFDFTTVQPVWSPQPEFALIWNAMSTSAPCVEPYLNQVTLQATQSIAPKHHALRQAVVDFIEQESNHYRIHTAFNRRLHAGGYDMTKSLDSKLKEDLKRFQQERSLAFNMAYCAGFENFSLFTAKFVFGPGAGVFEGADPAVVDLWLWHLAEEYEHRSFCHDLYAALSGNYFMRVYGLIYSFVHLNRYINQASGAFLRRYREGMTAQELAASRKREKAYKRRYGLYAFPRMLLILMPFHSPHRSKSSASLEAALGRYGAVNS